MNSQILIKLNDFVKSRLIEFLGILLVVIGIFVLASIASYSPGDPNFIYTPENTNIKNIGGFYGSVISDFLLQAIGLISFLIVINLLITILPYLILKVRILNALIQNVFQLSKIKNQILFILNMIKII